MAPTVSSLNVSGSHAMTMTRAWAGTCALFLGVGILTPVEMRYHFAAFPAIALIAAFGWSWAWRSRLPLRICAMLVLCAAVWVGFSGWMVMLG